MGGMYSKHGPQCDTCVTASALADRQGQHQCSVATAGQEYAKPPPEVISVRCPPSLADGQKAPQRDDDIPVDPCCEIIVHGVTSAFRRHPGTGYPFGHLSPQRMLVAFCAELLGTALLLFMGCMGGVAGLAGPTDQPHPLQGPLVFGMTVASIIQMVGHISVAHLNPAVTLCAVLRGDLTVPAAALYVIAQLSGALLGFRLLLGPFTGASMNPARTLAPALWKGVWECHWVYWAGPLGGSVLATVMYMSVFTEKTTRSAATEDNSSVDKFKADVDGVENIEKFPFRQLPENCPQCHPVHSQPEIYKQALP
ncbi:aquaporin-1-like isoform X2 [Schistocerca gregaria]|uniref:aquaporin-1-like isoform X2 n=1 Tax=Schistocerca gregaria TaxID=7010 RepID=UPI00211F1130|nr:aquaporin-1-like isoform X2 [Schistocerca gregaria]XP_049839421.1 aquaporin-1-like isoform X2 [Schistocerca gregaria]XP_049839423.1 aquaporin-1-like isoform X2 [Schistocerca gregaria]